MEQYSMEMRKRLCIKNLKVSSISRSYVPSWFIEQLIGHIIRNTEYLNCGALAQELSQGKYFSMLPKDDSCAILVNNLTIFLCLSKRSVRG